MLNSFPASLARSVWQAVLYISLTVYQAGALTTTPQSPEGRREAVVMDLPPYLPPYLPTDQKRFSDFAQNFFR